MVKMFPNADLKIHLDADEEISAKRRSKKVLKVE